MTMNIYTNFLLHQNSDIICCARDFRTPTFVNKSYTIHDWCYQSNGKVASVAKQAQSDASGLILCR